MLNNQSINPSLHRHIGVVGENSHANNRLLSQLIKEAHQQRQPLTVLCQFDARGELNIDIDSLVKHEHGVVAIAVQGVDVGEGSSFLEGLSDSSSLRAYAQSALAQLVIHNQLVLGGEGLEVTSRDLEVLEDLLAQYIAMIQFVDTQGGAFSGNVFGFAEFCYCRSKCGFKVSEEILFILRTWANSTFASGSSGCADAWKRTETCVLIGSDRLPAAESLLTTIAQCAAALKRALIYPGIVCIADADFTNSVIQAAFCPLIVQGRRKGCRIYFSAQPWQLEFPLQKVIRQNTTLVLNN